MHESHRYSWTNISLFKRQNCSIHHKKTKTILSNDKKWNGHNNMVYCMNVIQSKTLIHMKSKAVISFKHEYYQPTMARLQCIPIKVTHWCKVLSLKVFSMTLRLFWRLTWDSGASHYWDLVLFTYCWARAGNGFSMA